MIKLQSNFNCKLCDNYQSSTSYGLSKHLTQTHDFRNQNKFKLKEYYDKFLLKNEENKCIICGENKTFKSLIIGYKKYCNKCNKKYFRDICVEYWLLKGFSNEESILKVKESQSKKSKERHKKIKSDKNLKLKFRENNKFCIEYWEKKVGNKNKALEILKKNSKKAQSVLKIKKKQFPEKYLHYLDPQKYINQGKSKEEAELIVKQKINKQRGKCNFDWFVKKYGIYNGEIQWKKYCKTRIQTLENFIKKYGKKEGIKRWDAYLVKKSKSFEYIKTHGWSKQSQDMFWFIFDKIKNDYNEIYFATNDDGKRNNHINKEYVVRINNKKFHRLDFFIKNINFCLEFDCDYWHNDERDQTRTENIKKIIPDIKIMRVKSHDYIKNKDIIIEKILNTIKEIKNEINTNN
jgi:very-short-patch-repair endonuclease